ncbi:hypothetical protein BDZ89DRAFT_89493 [Hymenopellis radicata]|nr:hypothetical protein BDZ89DRAFT_89493 [Hymenopellis radicata]
MPRRARSSSPVPQEPASKRRRLAKEPVMRTPTPSVQPEAAAEPRIRELPKLERGILDKIFSFLGPYDLVQLSRTCNSLRSLLLYEDLREPWVQSLTRDLDGLDLEIPAVHPTLNWISWEAKEYHKVVIVEADAVMRDYRLTLFLHERICGSPRCKNPGTIPYPRRLQWMCEHCADHWHMPAKRILSLLKSPKSPWQNSDVPHEILKFASSRQSGPDHEPTYFLPQVDEYLRAYAHAEQRASSLGITFDVTVRLQSLKRYGAEVDPVCKSYLLASDKLLLAKNQRRTQRCHVIIELLQADESPFAQTPEKMGLPVFRELSFVCIDKVLDEPEWLSIRSEVERTLEYAELCIQRQVLAAVLRDVHHDCLVDLILDTTHRQAAMGSDLRHDILIPSPQEMIGIPEFREVVSKLRPWEEPTVDSFRPVFDCFPEIFNEWFREKQSRLVALLQEADPSADETSLPRVTTIFQCKTCHHPVTYPHVMVHWCDEMWTSPNCTRGIDETGGPTAWKTPASEFNFCLYPDTEEVVNHLVELFNHHCQNIPRENIASIGLEFIHPAEMISKAMNYICPVYACRTCILEYQNHVEHNAMTWLDAIHHAAQKHPRPHRFSSEVSFTILDSANFMDVKIDLLVKKQLAHQGYNLACRLPKKDATDGSVCGEFQSAVTLRRHMIGWHHKDVIERSDFVIMTDSERSHKLKKPLSIEMVNKMLQDRFFLTGMPILKKAFFP